jgi:hypothetical protein
MTKMATIRELDDAFEYFRKRIQILNDIDGTKENDPALEKSAFADAINGGLFILQSLCVDVKRLAEAAERRNVLDQEYMALMFPAGEPIVCGGVVAATDFPDGSLVEVTSDTEARGALVKLEAFIAQCVRDKVTPTLKGFEDYLSNLATQ